MSRRADPAVRAEDDLRRAVRAQKRSGRLVALVLIAAAAAAPFVVDGFLGTPGSMLGAVVASALCVGLAVAAWPWTWSAEELDHHRLEAIWRETRTDAGAAVPWPRYAAWADADGEDVRLLRLTCVPCGDPTPRRLRCEVVRLIDGTAIADAAEAMEHLRETCEDRERAALQAHNDTKMMGEHRSDDAALAAIDGDAAREERAAEERMRRELAAQETSERRAQAADLAEALRRP